MSSTLIIIVGIIYLSVSIDQLIKGDLALSLIYFGYAFANIGAYLLVAR